MIQIAFDDSHYHSREWLARLLHYFYCKQYNIYQDDDWIDTGWSTDGRNRGLWHDRALQLLRGLKALEKADLGEVPTAEELSRLLEPYRQEKEKRKSYLDDPEYRKKRAERDACPRCRYCRENYSFQYGRFPTCPVHSDVGMIRMLHQAGEWE